MADPSPRRRLTDRRRRRQRAIVLYLVLVISLLLLAAGAVLGVHLQRRMSVFRDQQRNLHGQALLDSATAVTLSQVYEQFTYTGVNNLQLDGGEVRAEVRIGPGTGLRELRLTAKFRGETRRAVARLRVENGRLPEVLSWRPVAAFAGE